VLSILNGNTNSTLDNSVLKGVSLTTSSTGVDLVKFPVFHKVLKPSTQNVYSRRSKHETNVDFPPHPLSNWR